MMTHRLPRDIPDVIAAVAAENPSRIYVYGITERGLDFMEDNSGDPPNVIGRTNYGWAVSHPVLDAVLQRATVAGLRVSVSTKSAGDAREAMKHWRDSQGRRPS